MNLLNFIFLLISIFYIVQIGELRDDLFYPQIPKMPSVLFKLITDILIIIAGQAICGLIKGLKEKNKFCIKFVISFIILFSVSFSMYLYTNFAEFNWKMWDANSVLENALKYDFYSYQHIYTVLYYLTALNLFPFIGGVMLFQIIVSSSIFAYIWAKLCSFIEFRYKWILLLPLFLFPVLRITLEPIRSCVYYVFALLLFALFYFKDKDSKPLSYAETVSFALLSSIVCAWRTENMLLLIIVPVMLFMLGRKKLSFLKVIIFLFIFYAVSIYTNMLMADKYYTYGLLPFKRPVSAILKTDFKTNDKTKDIEIISKCFSAEELKKSELNKANDVPLVIRDNNDIGKFIFTAIKLILLNPVEYIKERIDLSENFTHFYLLNDGINDYDLNSPTAKVLRTLEFYKSGTEVNYTYLINYSPVIPFLFLIIGFITALYKRQKMASLIIFTSLFISLVSYLFCAEPFFHYFLQSYVFGWFMFAYFVMFIVNKPGNFIQNLKT